VAAEQQTLRPPLGLPNGSVRALLTLIIVGLVVLQTLRDEPMGVMLAETLMVALAHYFTSRRLLKVPPHLRSQLEAEGLLSQEQKPLYLPRHTVRVMIALSFLALVGYLVWAGRLWGSAALGTIGVVFAYFLGVAVSTLFTWWSRRYGSGSGAIIWWEDAKAALVILTTGVFAIAVILGHAESLPHWMRNGSFGLILFYFGSR
jgi:hypothetical protein